MNDMPKPRLAASVAIAALLIAARSQSLEDK
jgi:hypothetical protein